MLKSSCISRCSFLSVHNGKSIEDQYKMMNQREHILLRPDMYVGSTKNTIQKHWLYDDMRHIMTLKPVAYNAGLFKIFDEILVNAADHLAENPEECRNISVCIDTAGRITIRNNGRGIPVVRHKHTGMWLPVMLFGFLLTSSNYTKNKRHLTGGKFGYGAKLTNILSKEFKVRTYDANLRKLFSIRWQDNMSSMEEPTIEHSPRELQNMGGFTEVSFIPDYNFLGLTSGLSEDMFQVLKRRFVDFAGLLPQNVGLEFNEKVIKNKSFEEFTSLFPPLPSQSVHVRSQKCEVVLRVSPEGFHQVSFVNNIQTNDGGTHVDYVVQKVCGFIKYELQKRHKAIDISAEVIKQNIFIFVNCKIVDPEFDSQIKSFLQSSIASVAGFPDLEYLTKKFCSKTNILSNIETQIGIKRSTFKEEFGEKVIPSHKLLDAELIQTDPDNCTLFVVEGDSAMNFAMSGISVLGRSHFGAIPLTGKIQNTWTLNSERQLNETLLNLLNALTNKDANGNRSLRYGRIVFMTDADNDGMHIRGLLANFLRKFIPQYLIDGKVFIFETPVAKVSTGFVENFFYRTDALAEFLSNSESSPGKDKIKYYKGLGSHTTSEIESYFQKYESYLHKLRFENSTDYAYFEEAFAEETKHRKQWILENKTLSDQKENSDHCETFTSFFESYRYHLLSICRRHMPNAVDGLTSVRRKIIYCILNQPHGTPVKVSQLAGRVSHQTVYNHTQTAISRSVISLSQSFVSSNNFPLLTGEGNFGTRQENGEDSAQDRYLYVKASPLLHYIFLKEDAPYLKYMKKEGIIAEPEFYTPVVPIHFLNGAIGWSFGFNTYFPQHDILDLIKQIRSALTAHDYKWILEPSYRNFEGKVETAPWNPDSHRTVGKMEKISSNCLHITEIPIGVSIREYRNLLNDLRQNMIVFDFKEYHQDGNIDFHVYLYDHALEAIEKAEYTSYLPYLFGLVSKYQQNCATCLKNETLVTFKTLREVFDEYVTTRLKVCDQRLKGEIAKLKKAKKDLKILVLFSELFQQKKISFTSSLEHARLEIEKCGLSCSVAAVEVLLKMSIQDICAVSSKRSALDKIESRLHSLQNKHARSLWLNDLDQLETKLNSIVQKRVPQRIKVQKKQTPKIDLRGLMSLKERLKRAHRQKLRQCNHEGSYSPVETNCSL